MSEIDGAPVDSSQSFGGAEISTWAALEYYLNLNHNRRLRQTIPMQAQHCQRFCMEFDHDATGILLRRDVGLPILLVSIRQINRVSKVGLVGSAGLLGRYNDVEPAQCLKRRQQ